MIIFHQLQGVKITPITTDFVFYKIVKVHLTRNN